MIIVIPWQWTCWRRWWTPTTPPGLCSCSACRRAARTSRQSWHTCKTCHVTRDTWHVTCNTMWHHVTRNTTWPGSCRPGWCPAPSPSRRTSGSWSRRRYRWGSSWRGDSRKELVLQTIHRFSQSRRRLIVCSSIVICLCFVRPRIWKEATSTTLTRQTANKANR